MCGLSTVQIQPSTLARVEKWNSDLMRIETFGGGWSQIFWTLMLQINQSQAHLLPTRNFQSSRRRTRFKKSIRRKKKKKNSGNSSLSDHSQNTNSTEEEGSGSTLLDSDFNAVLETKPSELLESTQTSIVEKQEEHKAEEKHEASSTEPSETTTPIPTTTSTPQNDTIFDVSETCDSDSICYVAPKNCTTNCEVIYAVSEKFENSTIYVRQGGVVHIKSALAYKAGERRL